MAHISDLIATDIEQYLKAHENKSLLGKKTWRARLNRKWNEID